jgi:hypothetical protein
MTEGSGREGRGKSQANGKTAMTLVVVLRLPLIALFPGPRTGWVGSHDGSEESVHKEFLGIQGVRARRGGGEPQISAPTEEERQPGSRTAR